MGDHRASIVIKFEMHGHEGTLDAWWNYYPDPNCEFAIDRRLLEWLDEQYKIAMDKYEKS